jgi:small-conductance mechanosensitive channel
MKPPTGDVVKASNFRSAGPNVFLGRSPHERPHKRKQVSAMNILLIVIAIVAIVLLFTGGFVQALNWLLWVGIILLVFAVIVWLVRMISGRRSV